ncbi:hypothetical protein DDZ18_02930 [Marinicauda salina]|uniref:Uncharacterized protein n=1 Tax=Marinicauda salina TaxID=2135793 RepID=A0A2U2BX78_9PROT|nr:sulfotransferase [Marinicauda salina]PWE18574.1 hypothetical protein DDZ18_02930 [Marinicauda salina]
MTPDYQALLQAGFKAFSAGRLDEAGRIADDALARMSGEPNALHLKAAALFAADRAGEAKPFAERASAAMAGNPHAANLLGLILRRLGEREAARAAFDRAAGWAPGWHEPAFNRARLANEAGDPEAAIADLRRALEIKPGDAPAQALLASLLLARGETGEAKALAEAALAADPHDLIAARVLARLDFDAGERDDAASRLEAALDRSPDRGANRSIALGLLGDVRDAGGDVAAAYAAWSEANALLAERHAELETTPGPYALATAERLAEIHDGLSPQPAAPAGEGPVPAFIVGFPRSGTTLLEQVLDAHPGVRTTDEAPLLSPIIEAAGGAEPDPAWFASLDAAERNRLRAAYWDAAGGPPEPGVLLVDKLPLNLIWLGAIAAVFPEAKIILALRDPRDCVLSAFRQRFGMNPAMYRMLTIEGAAAYYDAAMRAGEAARSAFPDLAVLEHRYEDMVGDLEGRARAALDHLGVGWHDDVAAYRDRLKAKHISTPSATQVKKPVYATSVAKWRDYDFALDPVRPVLDPWAERWGYEAS